MAARLQFEITEEQRLRISKVFKDYGQIRSIMSRVLNEVLDLVESHGYVVFAIILDESTGPKTIIPSFKKVKEVTSGDNKRP